MKLFAAVFLVIAASCSFQKSQLENQTLKGHTELYSEPEEPKLKGLDEFEKRIVIASTNDMHGNLEAGVYDAHDSKVSIGGSAIISEYFNTLRDHYKNIVLVDSGDLFSEATKVDEVGKFYDKLKYDAVTVGLRDFNLKVPAKVGSSTKLFQDFSKATSVPLLLSNLYELKTARTVEWEGTKPYIIKDFEGVRVGIIGLIPDDIVAQTPVQNRVGLFVENMLQSTLRHARLLRSLGADIIVVLTHQGIDCSTDLADKTDLPAKKVNFEPQKNVCDLKSPLGEYLERLPPNLVDVVIGGRNHQKMANFVNGTLVMGSFDNGQSFNYAEFVINSKTNKIVPEKTVVHQPVMFCHEFFKETKDCFYEDKSVNHKLRIPATFLGKPIGATKQAVVPGNKKFTYSHELKEIQKRLVSYKADLSYVPETSGETQLFVMNVSGKELVKILEEEYNNGKKDLWQPSPYLMKNDELTISIAGMDLELNKSYRILTDLESIQKHKKLVKQVNRYETEAIMSASWSSVEEDAVSVQLAAEVR
jgi:2',3'-cyclic-nucleotide 2'-phosphodiesterase (5'-nucleotidase family)